MFWDFPGSPVVKTPASNAGGMGLISEWGTKIPHALQCGQKKKKKKCPPKVAISRIQPP